MDDQIARWTKYQERTASGKPRSLVIDALSHITEKEAALDLGAGALNEAQFLLEQGFKEVVAVDLTPQFKTLSLPEGARFQYVQGSIESYDFPPGHFDLVSAQFTLPFLSKDAFERVWVGISQTLKPRGIFAGQLFGERDDWSSDSGMTFHSKEGVEELVKEYGTVICNEREYVEKDARAKHWHYFDLILRKK